MTAKFVVDSETAERDFERFAETMRLEIDPDEMTKDDLESFVETKRPVIKALRRGMLVIDDKGQPVYTPPGGPPITFYEPDGGVLASMDRKQKDKNVEKVYAMLAQLTREGESRYHDMKLPDLKVCQSILTLFLA